MTTRMNNRISETIVRYRLFAMFVIMISSVLSASASPIDSIVDTWREDMRYAQIRDSLSGFPPEQVIPVLVSHLRTDPRFESPVMRSTAYALLSHFYAERTPEGLAQLLEGLRKYGYGANALSRLGPDAPQEVIEAMGERLGMDDPPNMWVIRGLGAFKERSAAYLGEVITIFWRKDLDWPNRLAAGRAILQIGGVHKAMEVFEPREGDLEAERIAWGVLATWLGETDERNKPEESLRRSIQRRVRAGLKDPDPQARNDAIGLMLPAYLHDLLVQDAKGEWDLNPEFLAAFEEMATTDSDPGVRGRAQRVLDDKGTLKQNLLLRRERAAAP